MLIKETRFPLFLASWEDKIDGFPPSWYLFYSTKRGARSNARF